MNNSPYNILITGGVKRLGKVMAEHLLKQGHNVLVTYHTSYQEAQALQQQYPNVTCYRIDLADQTALNDLWDALPYKIDILINNAALFKNDDLNSSQESSFFEHYQVNAYTPLVMTQRFIQQGGDCIINMLDKWALSQPRNFLSYTLSKRTLYHITQHLIAHYPHIHTFGILLGFILHNQKFPLEFFQKHQAAYPSSIESLLRVLDFIIARDTIQEKIIDLALWDKTF